MKKTGFYIHIPFCYSLCDYCDFYSIPVKGFKTEKYIDVLVKNIRKLSELYSKDIVIDSIFFGGGTPNVYSLKEINFIVRIIKDCFDCDLKEVTMEINPNHITDINNYFADVGHINKFSIGVQDFYRCNNDYIGRKYKEGNFLKVIETLNSQNFYNINLDLVIGYENTDFNKNTTFILENDLLEKVSSFSVYMLSVKDAFDKKRRIDMDILDGKSASDYKKYAEFFKKNNFNHFEISNFCKTGYEPIHNLHYWNYDDFIAAGSGATMKINGGYFKYDEIEKYMEYDFELIERDKNLISKKDEIMERLIMNLRLSQGVMVKEWKDMENLEKSMEIIYNKYRDLVNYDGKVFSLNTKGFLYYNTVITDLLNTLEKHDEE